MTPSLRTGRRQPLKTAAHSLGTVVAITLVGIVVGALTGTAFGMRHGNLGTTGSGFDPIGIGGLTGAAAGGVVGSGMLAISAFFKGSRRKLVATTERLNRWLNRLAVLGSCSISAAACFYTLGWDAWYSDNTSLAGNITLLIVVGVATGVAVGVALGLLTVAALAAIVLVRISAGFLHPARKKPESVPANLIGGACDPWPIRTAAVLMPPGAGQRWRDDFNEARYDYEDDQHAKLLRDFLVHAPAVVVWAWIAALQQHVLGVGNSRERRW